MVLAQIPEIWAPWATKPSSRRTYPAEVERWRSETALLMPDVLKQRPDAERLVDKMLHVFNYESGGNPEAVGDGGNGIGLAQDRANRTPPGSTPQQQIANAWRLVLNNPDLWTDWGEGTLYDYGDGRGPVPFGALGNVPYDDAAPIAGGVAATTGRLLSGGGISITRDRSSTGNPYKDMARLVVNKRLDAAEARQALVDEEARARLELDLGTTMPALGHERKQAEDYDPMTLQEGVLGAENDARTVRAPQYGDDYVTAPTGTLRARLQQQRQGESQYGAITRGFADDPIGVATLAAYPFAPGWLAADVAAEKAGELAGGGIPGTVASLATGVAGPGLVKRGINLAARGASQADNMLAIVGREARDPVENYKKLREAGFSDKDIAATFGDDAVRLGKGEITPQQLADEASEARGLEQTASAMKYRPTGRGGSLAQRVRDLGTRLAGEGPVSSAVGRGDMFTDAAGAERRASAEAAMREADQAAIAGRTEQMARQGGGVEAVRQRSMERAAATADEIEAARLADEAAEVDRGLRAQAAEARAVEPRLQQREIEQMQGRVEAADLTRRRDEWLKTREEALAKAAEKAPPEGNAVLREILGVIGLTRTLPTSGDAGGIMRNTAVLGASRPAKWLSAAVKQLDAAFSANDARTIQQGVESARDYSNAVERWGWHMNDWGPGAKSRVPERSGQLENARIAQTVLNAPGIKQLQEGSERSLAVGRNVLGMDVIQEYADAFRKVMKVPDTQLIPPAEMDKQMSAVVRVVNHANGWSELAKGKDPFGVFFSLPYTISRFQLIADPLVEAMRGNPAAAKLALSNLTSFAGANAALLGFLAMTGQRQGGWSVNFNPTDGDFGQLKVGSTRFDTLAGLGPIIKTASRLGANVQEGDWVNLVPDLMRFFENKETPVFKAFTDAWVRKQLPDLDAAKDAVMPMMVSSIIDAFREGENPFLIGAGAIASSIGIGASTYNTPEDQANKIASDTFDGRGYDSLSTPEKLQVIAKLPADATRGAGNPKQKAREAYEAARLKAGYVEPEPKPKDRTETKSEQNKREAANADRAKTNAEVYAKNPELDVQRWFFDGGETLNSGAAVSQALALNVAEREVRYKGADRDLATEQGKALWAEHGKRIEDFYSPALIQKNMGLANYYAERRFEKPYAQLKPEDKVKIDTSVRTAVKEDNALLDAVLAYAGVGGNSQDKRYLIHSQAATVELEKLRAKYGREAAKPDFKFALAANAR